LPKARYALTTDSHFGDVHVSGITRGPSDHVVRAGTVAGDIDIGVLQ
jgi:hypothetical protein